MGNYGTTKWRRDVIAGLKELGIEVISMEHKRKHLLMRCKHGDNEWQQVLSVSPSSPVALQNAIREARDYRDGRLTRKTHRSRKLTKEAQ